MKTSLTWLGKYVDIAWDAAELAERLTLAGLEVEGIETFGKLPETVVAGEILSRSPHPGADKLSVCTVSTGSGDALQIVCGAANCDPGKKVPVALVGTDFGGGFKIKKAKLRGVESHGMMCSARELGLGQGHEGLLELPADCVPGTRMDEVFAADEVIDWEITPNRPDWASHYGIAREVAAVADSVATLKLPAAELPAPAGGQQVSGLAAVDVLAPDLCPRYTARVVRNVKIGPSPEWMQRALEAVGLRPINNVVDITNYVLMEIGQPLHAFDYDKLAGHKIVVRRANVGETLVTLDGSECELDSENLVIADAERGVALAGVMGGGNSEISESTTSVLVESAAFNASSVRRTARQHGFHTDSSYRFERGIDIAMVDWASRRACALMCEHAGGEMVPGVIDVYAAPYRPHEVSCRVARVNQLLGTDLDGGGIASLLARLGLDVKDCGSRAVTVAIPSHRLDLHREVDLIEEVARLHGLNNLPQVPTAAIVGGPRSSDAYYEIERARNERLGLGLSEAMNYSLLGVEDATAGTGVGEGELVAIRNPISLENSVMRPSVLPGLLKTVANNVAQHVGNLAMFEIARVVVNRPGTEEERYQAGIVLCGLRNPELYGAERQAVVDFFDLKGLLESWFESRGVAVRTSSSSHPAFAAGRCAAMEAAGRKIATLGEVGPALVKGMRLSHPLYMALVELDALTALGRRAAAFQPLPQFPATARDISLVAPTSLSNGEIVETILALDAPLLESVQLFDVYEDETAVGTGKRSLAYSLTYRDHGKTLTDGKANKAHDRLKGQLAAKLPVEYR
jgi:phenylalanyl-tRNA synthetase beta chain